MKFFLVLILSLTMISFASAQVEDTLKIYRTVDSPPEFPGGISELNKYILSNLKYPEEARQNGITGTVYIQFVVTSKGDISDVTLLRGPHDLLNEEAIRVVSQMPPWKPGIQHGKPVSVNFAIPIRFLLYIPD